MDEHRVAGKVIILTTPSPFYPAFVGPLRVAYVQASAKTVRKVFRANRDVAILCDQNRYAIEAGMVAQKLDGCTRTKQLRCSREAGQPDASCGLRTCSRSLRAPTPAHPQLSRL